MKKLKVFLLFFCFLLFISCKKKMEEEPVSFGCKDIFNTISSDTNYIPHTIGNSWNYCNENGGWNGWTGTITKDTIVGNNVCFTRTFDFQAGHSGAGAGTILIGDGSFHYIIDNSGNYYFLKYSNPYVVTLPGDTILLIKPSGINGDTIYNSALADVKVVLVDKNETFRTVTGCYHSRVIVNASSTSRKTVDHYFKKGIGEIYFTENIEKTEGEVLSFAKIN